MVLLIMFLLGLVFGVLGVVFLLIYKSKRKRYYVRTTATIVDDQHFRVDGSMHYGVYEYEYAGVKYRKSSNVGTTGLPKYGKQVTMYINPEKPEECMVKNFTSILPIIIFWGLSLLMVVIGIIFLIYT